MSINIFDGQSGAIRKSALAGLGAALILIIVLALVFTVFSSADEDETSVDVDATREGYEVMPAELEFSGGSITVIRNGEPLDAKDGLKLYPGDEIKVTEGTRATIHFFEGSLSELEGPCEIKLTVSEKAEDQAQPTHIETSLDLGSVASKVGKLASSDSSYQVKTANTIAGSWGTEYTVSVPQRNGATNISVTEGIVCVIWIEIAPDDTPLVMVRCLEASESITIPPLPGDIAERLSDEVWAQMLARAAEVIDDTGTGSLDNPLPVGFLAEDFSSSYVSLEEPGDLFFYPDEDSDGDGVLNFRDGCPTDPAKTEPGHCDCGNAETDSDADGAPDCVDECPHDPDKTVPGECGCGNPDKDTDGDASLDCADDCPNDPAKTATGECGCGLPDTDSDGDSVLDCLDGCPDDPAKTVPGECGCGLPDTDSDGDGVLDCLDGCPDDPAETDPGTCGCGVEEVDTDGDKTPDCVDGCPDDYYKTEPGVCGCGVLDVDMNNDGVMECITLPNTGGIAPWFPPPPPPAFEVIEVWMIDAI